MKEKYIVIESEWLRDLEYKVQEKIKEGYKPLGGIEMTEYKNFLDLFPTHKYAQSMVLDDD